MASSDDETRQEQANREVVASVKEFLGGPHEGRDGWTFEFGEHLESNWGAVYAGALAAGMLTVARGATPERSPRSLHVQIIRSVPRGTAYATTEVRHEGRTVATVEVDLYDGRRKPAAIALVTMVTPDAVAAEYHNTTATPWRLRKTPAEIPEAFLAPVQRSLRMLGQDAGGYVAAHAENVGPNVDGTLPPTVTITIPWDELEFTGPEAACLAADPVVTGSVIESFVPLDVAGPNADLSLRFTTAPATPQVRAVGTMVSVQHGTATVAIEVQAGAQLLAHGLSTSLLLPPK